MFSKPAQRLATTRGSRLHSPSSRLLLLACSATKRKNRRLLPAIDRYDGPAFRTLRKFWREGGQSPQPKDVYILSAKFGLIRGTKQIPHYDQVMNRSRATRLASKAGKALKSTIKKRAYEDGLAVMGLRYRQVLELETIWPFSVANGGIGYQLGILKSWLGRT